MCDDGFGMINADVICKELGFDLGALEVRSGGFYGNLDPPTRFMVDQLKCRGNETTLRECDFNGYVENSFYFLFYIINHAFSTTKINC